MTDFQPRHQLGYVLPIYIGDYIHYQFYRVCPDDCFIVCAPLGLETFSLSGAEQALTKYWTAVDFLARRGVHRITQGGIPISAYLGRKRTLELAHESSKRTGLPCSADIEESIDALVSLGVRKVAVAAKWSDELMSNVSNYLSDAGLTVVGSTSQAHTANEVVALGPDQGASLAVDLGRRAFQEHPEAEGLLLAGGAWLSLQAIAVLEAEFGRPVVSNPTASYWAALRQFGRAARLGSGRLLGRLGEQQPREGAPAW